MVARKKWRDWSKDRKRSTESCEDNGVALRVARNFRPRCLRAKRGTLQLVPEKPAEAVEVFSAGLRTLLGDLV